MLSLWKLNFFSGSAFFLFFFLCKAVRIQEHHRRRRLSQKNQDQDPRVSGGSHPAIPHCFAPPAAAAVLACDINSKKLGMLHENHDMDQFFAWPQEPLSLLSKIEVGEIVLIQVG